jgi:iron complex transport system permease protein
VYGSTWDEIVALGPWLVVCVPLAFVLARHMDALHLGEDIARGFGMSVTWQRGLLLLTSVALAAGAVATAGTIGFIGLIAPHIARRLVGATYIGLQPVAALTGGLIVVTADLVGRTIAAPTEIPCGVVTALIGAPFFLYLLYRRQRV